MDWLIDHLLYCSIYLLTDGLMKTSKQLNEVSHIRPLERVHEIQSYKDLWRLKRLSTIYCWHLAQVYSSQVVKVEEELG